MSTFENNPYQSPESGRKWVGGMRYAEACRFLFRNPAWMTNLGASGLCVLIPIIGVCVLNGYSYEVAETLRLTRGASYPDFTFNRFGNYLLRGLGGFVVQMVVGFFAAAIAIGLMVAIMIGIVVAYEGKPPPWFEIAFPLTQVVFQLVSLIIPYALWPWQFRAGMSEQVGEAFHIRWGFDFLTRNFLELVLASLLCIAMGCLVFPLGCMLAVVGMLPAAAYVALVAAHLIYQVHELHVRRDGTPVPWSASVKPFAAEYGHPIPNHLAGESPAGPA